MLFKILESGTKIGKSISNAANTVIKGVTDAGREIATERAKNTNNLERVKIINTISDSIINTSEFADSVTTKAFSIAGNVFNKANENKVVIETEKKIAYYGSAAFLEIKKLLLKKNGNKSEEGEIFSDLTEEEQDRFLDKNKKDILSSEKIRQKFLEVLRTAKDEIIIVSPWISDYAIDYYESEFNNLLRRGVNLKIKYGISSSSSEHDIREEKSINNADLLDKKYGVYKNFEIIRDYHGDHTKLLIWDKEHCLSGSYNLLSNINNECEETMIYFVDHMLVSELKRKLKL